MALSFSVPLDAATFSFSLIFIFLFIGFTAAVILGLVWLPKLKRLEPNDPDRFRDTSSIFGLNTVICILLSVHFILMTVVVAKEKQELSDGTNRRVADGATYIMADFLRRGADILAFCAVLLPVYRLDTFMSSGSYRAAVPPDDEETLHEEGADVTSHSGKPNEDRHQPQRLHREPRRRKWLSITHSTIIILLICLTILAIVRIIIQARFIEFGSRRVVAWLFSPRYTLASTDNEAYRITAHVDIGILMLTCVLFLAYAAGVWNEALWLRLVRWRSNETLVLSGIVLPITSLTLLAFGNHIVVSVASKHPEINMALLDFLSLFLTGVLYTIFVICSAVSALYPFCS